MEFRNQKYTKENILKNKIERTKLIFFLSSLDSDHPATQRLVDSHYCWNLQEQFGLNYSNFSLRKWTRMKPDIALLIAGGPSFNTT